jgi:hypothetical protein
MPSRRYPQSMADRVAKNVDEAERRSMSKTRRCDCALPFLYEFSGHFLNELNVPPQGSSHSTRTRPHR